MESFAERVGGFVKIKVLAIELSKNEWSSLAGFDLILGNDVLLPLATAGWNHLP